MMDIESKRRILQAVEHRRAERRRFLRYAGTATAMAGGLSLLAACDDDDDGDVITPTPTPTPTPTASSGIADVNVLNFALNLEYLEAQFYSFATTGQSLPVDMLSGVGRPGAVQGGRAVTFTDPVVAQYAREIAYNERHHVAFLREALGSAAIAQPAINIGGDAAGPFTAAARSAGVVGSNDTFDPYASDENFLLAAYLFEDVGVTAYKGAAPLLTNPTYVDAAAGILATEGYHAGLLRTALYSKGIEMPSLITSANRISDARDSLDGSSDLDQGITMDGNANLVPADEDGIAFSRSTGQVLNIVYLNAASTGSGGFFPVGVNGAFVTSGPA